jgi:hypothetical protein
VNRVDHSDLFGYNKKLELFYFEFTLIWQLKIRWKKSNSEAELLKGYMSRSLIMGTASTGIQ